jgi:hypothetical protein
MLMVSTQSCSTSPVPPPVVPPVPVPLELPPAPLVEPDVPLVVAVAPVLEFVLLDVVLLVVAPEPEPLLPVRPPEPLVSEICPLHSTKNHPRIATAREPAIDMLWRNAVETGHKRRAIRWDRRAGL